MVSFSTIPPMSFQVRSIREEKERPSKLKKLLERCYALWQSVSAFRISLRNKKQEDEADAKRVTYLKTGVTVLIAVLCALLLLAGTAKALLALKVFSFSNFASVAGAPLPEDEHGFTNLLLLGEGNSDHDGVDLTDTIMIASVDPKTRSAVMLSLPRDVYILSTEQMGKGRINSLYRNYKSYLRAEEGMKAPEASIASMKELQKEVGKLVGLEIHGSVKINFSGFEEAIDALGGIDVEVAHDIVDPEYPGPNYSYETFAIAAGPQHLDGKTALKYARSRHSTSDFSRSARQQQIISAAMQKATDSGIVTNVSRLTDLLSIVAKNIETTFSTRELISLAALGKEMDRSRIVNMQLNDQAGLYGGLAMDGGFLYAPPREQFDGASVLLPVSFPEFPVTWKQVQMLGQLIFQHRGLYFRPPSVAVLNNGAKSGMARKLGSELIRYGFNVVSVTNYPKEQTAPSQESSFIGIALPPPAEAPKEEASRLNNTAGFFTQTFGLKPMAFTGPVSFEDNPEIVIVLGEDYIYEPLQTVLEGLAED